MVAIIKDMDPIVTHGDILFVRPNSWPNNEKPYVLLYTPTDSLSMSNFDFTDKQSVPLRDLRPKKGHLSLDREGFVALDFKTSLDHGGFHDEDLLESVYIKELRPFLLDYLGAQALFIHECVVSILCTRFVIDWSLIKTPHSCENEILIQWLTKVWAPQSPTAIQVRSQSLR